MRPGCWDRGRERDRVGPASDFKVSSLDKAKVKFRDRDPRGGEATQEFEGPESSSLLNSEGNLAKSAFARALPCSPVSRTWASPGQLPGGERSGWEGDHISLVEVEDKLKVKIEVKRRGLEGDHSLNEHQQENLDCEQEHNQRR